MRTMKLLLALLLGGIGGAVALTSPAAAVPLSYYCPASTICYFDDVFGHEFSQPPTPINRDVGDAPRNTCFGTADFMGGYPGNARLIVNNSNFYWFVFKTSGCTGAHLSIAPYSKLNPATIDDSWTEIHGHFRTSTTG